MTTRSTRSSSLHSPSRMRQPQGSVEEIFRRSYRSLVGSLGIADGNMAAAEDAVQDAFCQAYQRWDQVGQYDDPTAWIRRVAINRLHNNRRSRQRGARAILRLIPGRANPTSTAPVPDDRIVRADDPLRQALNSLSDNQRLAAVLYYINDLSTAEVAAAMGVTQGTVSQHLSRARTTLRAQLKPWNGEN